MSSKHHNVPKNLDEVKAYLKIGDRLVHLQEYEKAGEAYQKAKDLCPNAQSWAAREAEFKLLTLNNRNATHTPEPGVARKYAAMQWYGIGEQYVMLKDYEAALSAFKTVTRLYTPNAKEWNVNAWYWIACICHYSLDDESHPERLDYAFRACRRAISRLDEDNDYGKSPDGLKLIQLILQEESALLKAQGLDEAAQKLLDKAEELRLTALRRHE